MDNQQFADELAKICGLRFWESDLNDRKRFINVNSANYGNPSSVIIEFEGSPAKFQIFMNVSSAAPSTSCLYVAQKWLNYGSRRAVACAFIAEYLKTQGFDISRFNNG